nr:hypothetical protein [Bacteroidota bacterium]
AQCCSPGTPIAGSANIGILDKNKFRLIGFYRHSYSDRYFEGHRRSDYSFVSNAGFDFSGLILGYGLTEKMTLEAEAGYFFRKYQTYNLSSAYTLSGAGFSSGVITLKRNLYKNIEREWEITAGTGAKLPFARSLKAVDGVTLPQDIQPSTGAFGFVSQIFISKGYTCTNSRLFLINRTEVNGTNKFGYRYGSMSQTSLFYSKKLTKNLTGLFQTRHEVRLKDIRNEKIIDFSGGHQVFLAPQLSYTLPSGINISTTFDTPVFQYLNEKQIGNKYSFSFILIKDF